MLQSMGSQRVEPDSATKDNKCLCKGGCDNRNYLNEDELSDVYHQVAFQKGYTKFYFQQQCMKNAPSLKPCQY